jgi:hypothetical protein
MVFGGLVRGTEAFLQTLLKCVAAASLMAFIALPISAAENDHRHLTHEGSAKNRMLPANFHAGNALAALDAKKKGSDQGPTDAVITRHPDMHQMAAQPHS